MVMLATLIVASSVFHPGVCCVENDRQLTVLPPHLKLIWSTEEGRDTQREMSAASRLV